MLGGGGGIIPLFCSIFDAVGRAIAISAVVCSPVGDGALRFTIFGATGFG